MAGKAKALSEAQVKAAFAYLRDDARYPEKSPVLFLLSLKAGLRAKRVCNACHGYGVRMTSSRISVMSSMAKRMPSRPRPLSLTPP